MAILPSDIKLLESERMRDTPDGGGRMTGNIIPSGVMNNVFPKVSRVDSVYGRVNLRKIYVAVRTATLDMYAGAHSIITDPPDNDRISCVLFSTGSSFDTRTQARNRIESYVVAGPLSRMRLYGNQLIGQKAISTYQRVEEPLPDVGDVLVLSVEASGHTPAEQYVRITDVEHEVRTFTDDRGDYDRRVLLIKIGSTLAQTFTGAEPSRFSSDPSPTKVRVTQVADASKYYGIQPITELATAGALSLRLSSVYAPLVPSTQRETAVSLASITGATVLQASAAGTVEVSMATATGDLFNGIVCTDFVPGTLVVSVWRNLGGIVSLATAYDDGAGNLRYLSTGGAITGTIDYDTRRWSITGQGVASTPDNRSKYRFQPRASISGPANTKQVPVTLGTRGSVYVESLRPIPAPGTLVVDYRALGKWYRLRDDGSGQLVGNQPSEGTGSVDYISGAVIVTLGALPDVDSSVLYAWGTPAHYDIRTAATIELPAWTHQTAHQSIEPGSVVVTWEVEGVPKTAAADAAGVFSGDGAGRVNHALGQLFLRPTSLPDPGTTPQVTYDAGGLVVEDFTPSVDGNGFVQVTVAGAPIAPKSIVVELETIREKTETEKLVGSTT